MKFLCHRSLISHTNCGEFPYLTTEIDEQCVTQKVSFAIATTTVTTTNASHRQC